MLCRTRACALIALACTAGVAMAALHVWVGLGSDPKWTTCGNWLTGGQGEPCYPDQVDDYALIPYTPDGHEVHLTLGIGIGSLTITGPVDFSPAEGVGNPLLTVRDAVTITGQASETTVTISGGAKIWAQ